MSRFLGVDFGVKRIGLAVGEAGSGIATPLRVLNARPATAENAAAILAAAQEYDAAGIVIGLPLNMDGTEGQQAQRSRQLAAALRRRTKRAVVLHDERLTSFAADQKLAGRGLSRGKKKARQDALAAAAILQSFFDRSQRRT
ncbi:MAG: Holliday junction resolvase RuvX [Phycisphaerae bacterium]|jgi:putative Holliday junction resolvase